MRILNQYHPDFRYSAKSLVGIKELTEILGLGHKRSTLTTWNFRAKPTKADSIVHLASGPIYDKWEYLLAWNDSVPVVSKPGELSEADASELSRLIDLIDSVELENFFEDHKS